MNARRLLALLLVALLLPACGDGSTAPPPPLPTAPSNLSIAGKTSGRVHLAWDDLSTDETGFTIERRSSPGDWGVVGTAGIDEETFVDRGLPTLTTVEYRVRPTNNPTGWSNTAVDTTDGLLWGGTVGGGPAVRAGHSLIHDAAYSRLVLFGGLGDLDFLDEVWVLDVSGAALGAWTPVTPAQGPAARAFHSAVYDAVGQRMIVFGGSVNPNPDDVVNDVWELSLPADPANFAWQAISPTGPPPTARFDHSTAFDPSLRRLVIFGGHDFNSMHSDLRSLDLDTMEWADHGSPPFGRFQHSAVWDIQNDRMVVHGGNDGAGSVSATTWFASIPATGVATWTPFIPTPFGRTWSSTVYDEKNRRMIVFGGVSHAGVNYGDVWALPLTPGGSWQQVPVGGGPSARYYAGAAYDPVRERMVVFSGFNDDLGDYPDALAWPLQFGVYPP